MVFAAGFNVFVVVSDDCGAVVSRELERYRTLDPQKIEVITVMKEKLIRFFQEEEGLTTVEYAVAGALITVAVVAAFTTLGGSVAGTINIIDAVLPG